MSRELLPDSVRPGNISVEIEHAPIEPKVGRDQLAVDSAVPFDRRDKATPYSRSARL